MFHLAEGPAGDPGRRPCTLPTSSSPSQCLAREAAGSEADPSVFVRSSSLAKGAARGYKGKAKTEEATDRQAAAGKTSAPQRLRAGNCRSELPAERAGSPNFSALFPRRHTTSPVSPELVEDCSAGRGGRCTSLRWQQQLGALSGLQPEPELGQGPPAG